MLGPAWLSVLDQRRPPLWGTRVSQRPAWRGRQRDLAGQQAERFGFYMLIHEQIFFDLLSGLQVYKTHVRAAAFVEL